MCMPQKYALYDNEFMGKRCRCEMSADSWAMDCSRYESKPLHQILRFICCAMDIIM